MSMIYDIGIIGGGASGVISAVCANINSNKTKKIAIFEKEDKLCKKVYVTGNGRCNLTNDNIDDDFYYGGFNKNLTEILNKYSSKYIIDYFNNLGLITKSDNTGRIYPYSNSATSVVDVLKYHCNSKNINTFLNFDVDTIKKTSKNTYIISNNIEKYECKKIIISTGGKSGVNKYSGNGYKILDMLNISHSPIFPSLCPIPTKSNYIKHFKGCRAYGKVTLTYKEICTDNQKSSFKSIQEVGEIQFTETSLSGICVFNISRFVNEYFALGTIKNIKSKNLSVSIDFFPDYTTKQIETIIENKIKSNINNEISNLLLGLLHYKIAFGIFKYCNITKEKNVSTLTTAQKNSLINALKSITFEIAQNDNFKNSQVTCGGVPLDKININTMNYIKDKNIFITGEILDIDGLCGGYNLHWAWVSGILAGKNIIK